MEQDSPSLSIPITQKLRNIPGIFGIRLKEVPQYEVIKSEGDKEIRKYRAFIMASININGDFEEAKREGFLSLLQYLCGENKDRKNLKMTSPIFHELIAPNTWCMSFILPFTYSLATAPTPKDKKIHLHKSPEKIVATLRYSGQNSQSVIKEHSAQLMEWINKNHFYNPISEIQSAEYDGPRTISFLRKNEIHIEVSSFQ